MNGYYDDKEDEPLSLDDPIDWYYDGTNECGYAMFCYFKIFRDFTKLHNVSLKLWGVSFDGLKPIIESENIRFDIIESNVKKEYAHLKIHMNSGAPDECEFRVRFHCDFYFGFIETKDDGTIIELDYYDDFCQK